MTTGRQLAFLLLLAAVSPAFGQFWDLAATDDGRQLYFGSSLVLPGFAASSPSEVFLYRLDQNGIQLVSANAMAPQVSGDGQVVGYTDPTFCTARPFPASCVEAMLLSQPPTDLGTGDLQLSKNGRWALIANVGYASSQPPVSSTLIDLTTGTRTAVPPRPVDSRPFVVGRSLASGGSLLVQATADSGASYIGFWRNGSITPIPVSYTPGTAYQALALSDDARTYFYSLQSTAQHLIARNLADGSETSLFTASPGTPPIWFLGASRDGRTVLFRTAYLSSGGPAYIADTVSGASIPITLPNNELVTDGTLSGSGETAFLVTTSARMIRVDVRNGAPGSIDEIIPSTPYLSSEGIRPIELFPTAPGEVTRMWGAWNGPPGYWNGRILIDEEPVGLISAANGVVDFQVPWDVAVGIGSFRLDLPASGSPFQQNQKAYVNAAVPAFAGASGGLLGLAIALQDFSALLTRQPDPGEIVHLYMTGLGSYRPRLPGPTHAFGAVVSTAGVDLMSVRTVHQACGYTLRRACSGHAGDLPA